MVDYHMFFPWLSTWDETKDFSDSQEAKFTFPFLYNFDWDLASGLSIMTHNFTFNGLPCQNKESFNLHGYHP